MLRRNLQIAAVKNRRHNCERDVRRVMIICAA